MSLASSKIALRIAAYYNTLDVEEYPPLATYSQVWPVAALADGRLKEIGLRWRYRRPYRLQVASEAFGRAVSTFNELTPPELEAVREVFHGVSNSDLKEDVANVLFEEDMWI